MLFAQPLRQLSRRCRAISAVALACLTLLSVPGRASAADPAPSVAEPRTMIQAPHYGDSLFSFYQSKYFSAITGLMVSQHFDRLPQHADEAEVLRGGLLLSYGLHRDAGDIFAKLIDQSAAPSVRNRAWFYLAKIRYQRDLPAEAEAALARIDGALPVELQEDRALLQAQLLMARGDFAGAAAALENLPTQAQANRYARFNLGVALVKGGDATRGRALLEQLGSTPADSEEQRSLRDKANVALGFAALQDNRAGDASAALQRVRLSSPQANKALLGFGWASAAQKDPKAALVPWTELAKRESSDAAVLEARIAVPYAHAELGAYGQALQGYESAIAAYEQEHRALDESIAAVRSGKLMQSLDNANTGVEMGWFWQLRELPSLPHPAHLTDVMAEHAFQEAFKNYRDLLFLSRNLNDWADKLGSFSDMRSVRQQAFKERMPRIRAQANTVNLDAIGQRQAALAEELARIEAQQDTTALAASDEQKLLSRMAQARTTIDQLATQPGKAQEAEAARERLRLAEGALTWQMAQQMPARMWEHKKSLRTMQAQLSQAREHEAALNQAQSSEPAKFAGFDQRIVELDARIKALIPRVAVLTNQQQQVAQNIAVAALESQQERLATYVRQARFAIAQLYDLATVAKTADRSDDQGNHRAR